VKHEDLRELFRGYPMSHKFDSELNIYVVSGKGFKAVVKAKDSESAERLIKERTKKACTDSYMIGTGKPNFMSDECCSPPNEFEEIVLIKQR
jgi:hypothetical protein